MSEENRGWVKRSLFGDGGYADGLADLDELGAVSDAAVRDFARASVSPRDVTLIGVGDVTADGIVQMLDASTKRLVPSRDVRPSGCASLPTPPRTAEIRVIDDPGAAQSFVVVGAAGVPVGHVDGPRLAVLASAMGAPLSGRLSLPLRAQHGLTYGVVMTSRQWRAQA